MRHVKILTSLAILLLLAAGLSGCGGTKQETAMETTSDSLVAANPQELGTGDITPESQYQEPAPTKPAPAPSSSPPPAPRRRTSPTPSPRPSQQPAVSRGITVPSGTAVEVAVNTPISTETAKVGDTWTGTVKNDITVDGQVVIPAGSTVSGTVTAVTAAEKGSRASLDLGLSSIAVGGRTYDVNGGTEAIVAGSTRARNLGAIAAGTAAGAIVGRAVGGSGKGALIGGLIGGAATGTAVAKSKGYQVVLKEGTALTFTTTEAVAVRKQ